MITNIYKGKQYAYKYSITEMTLNFEIFLLNFSFLVCIYVENKERSLDIIQDIFLYLYGTYTRVIISIIYQRLNTLKLSG